ncbi:2-keto-4-pentenoate hydratase [Roseobacter sp. HKCCA0434]|uniref:2-keto-4-pentenoate hydratase n=1 Tax=Roseobacter sp. HKCCA0434 TaxID=3079297 RepID=UPI002905D2D6|nr:fumarylacetoacetate hydrolase family protein [Roseobacter sp. HKCCA0434]
MSGWKERAEEVAQARAAAGPFLDYGDVPDMATAYAMQDALAAVEGVSGWKIAWNRPELQAKFQVESAAVAHIPARKIMRDGAVLPAEAHMALMLEPEIAAVLSSDLTGEGHTADSVAGAVAELVPAWEVLDRRGVATMHGPTIAAQGIFNAGAVIGRATGATIGRTTVRIGGELVLDAEDAAPEPPLQALAFVANTLGARGIGLKAGQVVLCGSHTPLLPIAPGQVAELEIAGLGAARLSVAEGWET